MYHHSLRQDVFIKDEYHYLNVPKVGTFTVYDSLDCTFECLGNPSCLSFNLAAYKGADGKLRCELLSSEKYSNPEEYKRNESFHHFSSKVGLILCIEFKVRYFIIHQSTRFLNNVVTNTNRRKSDCHRNTSELFSHVTLNSPFFYFN